MHANKVQNCRAGHIFRKLPCLFMGEQCLKSSCSLKTYWHLMYGSLVSLAESKIEETPKTLDSPSKEPLPSVEEALAMSPIRGRPF